jgi:hypothetical protein
MARISLYIPDELRARMDAAGSEINWSDVARPALTAAIATFEHRKGQSMSTAIERLRASRQLSHQRDKDRGNRHGCVWAEKKAEYRALRDLVYRRSSHPAEEPLHALKCVMDPVYYHPPEEEFEHFAADDVDPEVLEHESDEYWQAFIDGAVSFFQEVRQEVERE